MGSELSDSDPSDQGVRALEIPAAWIKGSEHLK